MGPKSQVVYAVWVVVNLSEDFLDHLLSGESTEEPGEVDINLTKPNSPRPRG
jgi:hypothetical protein